MISFSFYFWEEYLKFYEENRAYEEKLLFLDESLDSFSLESLEELESVELHYTPDKSLLDKIVLKIKNAKNRVFINTYIFSEKRIREEIIKAKNRWLDIKVVLEKNPYKAYNINNKPYDSLVKNNIKVNWSNPRNFTFNHAKYLIIDDELIVSTWNISYSTFTKNRDFFLFINDKKVLDSVLSVFNSDFNYKKDVFYDSRLVLSPEYSRYKLEYIIKDAKSSLKIYAQYLYDENFISLVLDKSLNTEIEIIVRDNFYLENTNLIRKLESSWIKVYSMNSPVNHSKAILVDDKYLFIWSINISKNSIDKNRELGIIFSDKDSIEKFKNVFNLDVKK